MRPLTADNPTPAQGLWGMAEATGLAWETETGRLWRGLGLVLNRAEALRRLAAAAACRLQLTRCRPLARGNASSGAPGSCLISATAPSGTRAPGPST